jgi:hypothetical protein
MINLWAQWRQDINVLKICKIINQSPNVGKFHWGQMPHSPIKRKRACIIVASGDGEWRFIIFIWRAMVLSRVLSASYIICYLKKKKKKVTT